MRALIIDGDDISMRSIWRERAFVCSMCVYRAFCVPKPLHMLYWCACLTNCCTISPIRIVLIRGERTFAHPRLDIHVHTTTLAHTGTQAHTDAVTSASLAVHSRRSAPSSTSLSLSCSRRRRRLLLYAELTHKCANSRGTGRQYSPASYNGACILV